MNCLKIFDLVLMLMAYGFATLARLPLSAAKFTPRLVDFIGMRIKVQNFLLFACFVVAWHLVLYCCGLYGSKRLVSRRQEVAGIVKAISIASLILFVAAIGFRVRMIDIRFMIVFWAVVAICTVVSRFGLRFVLGKIRRHGRNLRWMLIAGTNSRALDFAGFIESQPELGYRILGFVDQDWDGSTGFQTGTYRRVCDFAGFPAFLRANVVDELVIALPMRSCYLEAAKLAAACEEQGIAVRQLAVFGSRPAASWGEEEGGPLVGQSARGGDAQLILKRALDIVLSGFLLVLFAPLLLAVFVLVRLTSEGPALFVQTRLGVNKRRFSMFKFRTMVMDAEQRQASLEHLNEAVGSVFKIKNDPRMTRFGKFLRKTSIDELPQLLNVLKGEMSMVGPRPLPNRDYEKFDKDWQRRRFCVRPGITCLWQIYGRSSVGFDEWMQLDLRYIDQWSLWLDLRILVRTVPAVLRGSGAV